MSGIEIEGVMITRDYKAKERRLSQIIAARDSEVAALRREIEDRDKTIAVLNAGIDTQRDKIKALRTELTRRRADKKDRTAPAEDMNEADQRTEGL